MTLLAGVDIGGTKCAVSLGRLQGADIEWIAKRSFPTEGEPSETIAALTAALDELLRAQPSPSLAAVGISCGGPLDSQAGLILSPPNLPGWDRVEICRLFRDCFGVPAGLQNDANACALAEWRWGAGRGSRNMIFLTFGTGMGAGLILDGRLYSGTNDMAGEAGHMRLREDGPIGYGKAGSFEGFCSGGGIAQLARTFAGDRLRQGERPSFAPTPEELSGITAQKVAEAARRGDPLALDIFRIVGCELGKGLSVLVDLLNPERIVIGSIYARQQSLLEPLVLETLRREALPRSLSVCQIVPAGLGERVGDYAGLSVAWRVLQGQN